VPEPETAEQQQKQRRDSWMALAMLAIGCLLGYGLAPKQPSCEQLDNVAQKIEVLESKVSGFDDGITDWKQVVEEVRSETAELQSLVELYQCRESD
jgi:hypothetical protein